MDIMEESGKKNFLCANGGLETELYANYILFISCFLSLHSSLFLEKS
jgi:hypothetical protein